MTSSYTRLGLALTINGLAAGFLAASLLGDGNDLQATASRAYLALMMIAPMALFVVLALPPLHRDAALKGTAVVSFALLLAVGFEIAGDPGPSADAGNSLPRSSQVAGY